ncbi:MAG TPA: hypothetical protein VFK02_01940 [Kofleriaceae bacterium]|nr:hypothetical protein [Kofleriaceae bacterium]
MIHHSLLVLVLLTSTAIAQPATPPAAGPPAASTAPNGRIDVDLDALIAKAQAEAPTIETVARGTFRRARRALSIGPTVGLWTAAIIDPGDLDAALTIGVGLEMFNVPVIPSMETLQDLVVERVKAQAKQRILDVFKGRQPEPLELDTLVKQVYDDVRSEILGLQNVRPKTFERPKYTIGFEANRLFGADRWLGRTRVGIGVWKVTLGLSAAVGRVCRGGTCDDGVKAFIGPEIVLHALPSDQPRASVVDAFVRADFQASGRGVETYDHIVLGARYLLDIF